MGQTITFTNDGVEYEVDISDMRKVPKSTDYVLCSRDGKKFAIGLAHSLVGSISICLRGWSPSTYSDSPKGFANVATARGAHFTYSEIRELIVALNAKLEGK